MAKPKIIVTRRLPPAVEDRLKDIFTVAFNTTDKPLGRTKLLQAMTSADGILTTLGDDMDEVAILAKGKRRVQIIANFGVGVNHIDLDSAEDEGLVVTNTPGVLTDATADIAMTLILNSTRRTWELESNLRSGNWAGFSPTATLGTSLRGKTLGIIGMGRIGLATAMRAHFGFGMNIAYFNRSKREVAEIPGAWQTASIEELMQVADVVSIHAPGGEGTNKLVSAELIAMMKPSAHLVNTSRGDLIDEDALIAALQAGKIAGAGLDVFADEPDVPQALIKMKNVSLFPHIGSATIEAREAMGMMAVDNLVTYFQGGKPPNALF